MRIGPIAFFLGLSLSVAACQQKTTATAAEAATASKGPKLPPDAPHEVIKLKVEGMHCDGCAGAIRSFVGGVPGVLGVAVQVKEHQAQVYVSPGKGDLEAIYAAIKEAGYTAKKL